MRRDGWPVVVTAAALWVVAAGVIHYSLRALYSLDQAVLLLTVLWCVFAAAVFGLMVTRVAAEVGALGAARIWFALHLPRDGNQLMIGIAQVAAAGVVRMVWWLPWRYYRAAAANAPGEPETQAALRAAAWFAEQASVASLFAALLAVHGYFMHIHPAMSAQFGGRWPWLVTVAVLLAGALVAVLVP